MNAIEKRLIDAYTILVLAERKTIEEVPETTVMLAYELESTIRSEVEIKVAEKTIEVLS